MKYKLTLGDTNICIIFIISVRQSYDITCQEVSYDIPCQEVILDKVYTINVHEVNMGQKI